MSSVYLPRRNRTETLFERELLNFEDNMADENEEPLALANTPSSSKEPLLSRSKNKTGLFVYTLTFFAAVGGFLFGYDTGVVSGALVILKKHFHLSFFKEELVVSVTIATAIVGALAGGPTSHLLGRKTVLISAAFVFTVGAVCMAVAQDIGVLLVGRAIVGIGIGLASMTVPVYIAEAAPTHLRGRLVTLNALFITGGQFIASVVDGIFCTDKENGWRYMLGLSGVPAVIMFFGLLFMPESPRWLISKGKMEKARKILQRIRNVNNVEEEIEEITTAIHHEQLLATRDGSSENILKHIWNNRAVRRALFVGCGLQAFQQLSGINTVMYYSSTIIKMAGTNSDEEAIWLAVPVAFTNFAFTLVGLAVVERMGRRKLLLISLAGVVFSLLLLSMTFLIAMRTSPDVSVHPRFQNLIDHGCSTKYSTCYSCIEDSDCGFCYTKNHGDIINASCLPVISSYNTDHSKYGSCNTTNSFTWNYEHCPFSLSWLAVLGLILYLAWFAPGMGPMPWTINSEIYPQWARSFGNSSSATTNWICNLFVSMTFLNLTKVLTKCGTFGLYTGIAILGWLFTYCFLPETKGKTLEEVTQLFEQGATRDRMCLTIGNTDDNQSESS